MLIADMMGFIILIVVMLNVIRLSVVMTNVVMLNVVAPFRVPKFIFKITSDWSN